MPPGVVKGLLAELAQQDSFLQGEDQGLRCESADRAGEDPSDIQGDQMSQGGGSAGFLLSSALLGWK